MSREGSIQQASGGASPHHTTHITHIHTPKQKARTACEANEWLLQLVHMPMQLVLGAACLPYVPQVGLPSGDLCQPDRVCVAQKLGLVRNLEISDSHPSWSI